MKKQRMKAVALSTVISAGALIAGVAQADQKLDNILSVGQAKVDAARVSQVRINKLQDQTGDLIENFKQENKVIDGLKVYNTQMEARIQGQLKQLAQIDASIKGVKEVQRLVPPLNEELVNAMDAFVKEGSPFKKELRLERVQKVRDNLTNAKLSNAEIFRQVVELYKKEADYSRNIYSYPETVNFNGTDIKVTVLAIGRVALMFQSEDRSVTAAWDYSQSSWVELADKVLVKSVYKGIRMAQKKASNDILALPILAPEVAQ